MYERILVATDGSSGTEAILDHAIATAEPYDATVTPLYVVDSRVVRSASDRDPDDVREELESAGEDALATAADRLEDAGIDVETERRNGNPEREILSVADDIDADLVVLGSHGKSPREKVAGLGSVSESVVKNADRPVMVTRLPDE
ncbi:universal stress protein [Halanaeroarchaeum sulfurireducens]|uniref:UspA domain-containing protein n=1 Tax=Halanaeroarchaeum sulfurireducens TaxID=1604004 RepID=A0A0F7PC57_9EURY|nr:universal stress protein [Halanaeroarchaeum sulfurireducens]AKH97745.1 UspA domain-containing protein [Halanaeroarchaeum sulfurireducens]ALG82140.1 UspA domain-containing protein [Halanaeroarchaeum sulfurireducens]